MSKRRTYLFTGTITTLEPLAWSPPGHVGPDKRALLPRMTVPTAAGPVDAIYLGASTIRGRYRHACADVSLERERPVSLERYLQSKVGGVKGTARERRVGLLERDAYLQAEPLLSLFGAGASDIGWIHGRLDVGAALPAEPAEPVVMTGTRGDTIRDPVLFEVLNEEERQRVERGLEANGQRGRAAARGRELKRQVARAKRAGEDDAEPRHALERMRELEEQATREQSEHLGSDVSLLLPLPGYEAIPPGTVLDHRMFFRHVCDAQMQLFMAGLVRFAEDPRFGAHRAHGCGRVRVDYQVRRLDGVHAQIAGDVSIDPHRWDRDGSSLALSGAPARWLEACQGAARSP